MKAQKLPSGSYRVQVTVDGKRISVTADSEDEALYRAAALKTYRERVVTDSPTVGECLDEYITSKENVLSPKTTLVYRQIRNNGLATLCDIPVDKLTNQRIQIHFNSLALKRSAKTVHNAHSLLVSVMSVYNPDLRIRTALPKIPKKIKQLPTAAELMGAIVGSDIELPCILALWLGLRLSEILGAKRADIFDMAVQLPTKAVSVPALHIHNTIITVGGKQVEKSTTKTKDSTRSLPLPPYIINLINQLPPEQEYLVTYKGQAIYKKFKRLLKLHNLPDITFHDLRHVNASVMLALGIPDKYAMERGGWSSDKVMKNVYQHTFAAERHAADDMVDNYFNAILAHENAHDK